MQILTGNANTKDWLEVSKDMKIRAYIGLTERNAEPYEIGTRETEVDEPAFGTHIREATAILKDWFKMR